MRFLCQCRFVLSGHQKSGVLSMQLETSQQGHELQVLPLAYPPHAVRRRSWNRCLRWPIRR